MFASYRYPFIDVQSGGSVRGVVRAIDHLLPLIDEKTKIIPGHGGLSSKKDVLAYRRMIATVADRVESMAKAGKSLQEVIAAKPTRDFDEQWGKFRKPDVFVEIVYSGFAPKKAADVSAETSKHHQARPTAKPALNSLPDPP